MINKGNNKLFTVARQWCLAVCLLLTATTAMAGQEPVLRNVMKGTSVAADSFRIVEDLQYTLGNLGNYQLYKAGNLVSLEINQDQVSHCYLDSFWFSVTLEVTGWDKNGTSVSENISLDVLYDQRPGKEYRGIHSKRYAGFYKLQVKVLSVSNPALRDFIRVSGEISLERYRQLDTAAVPVMSSLTHVTGSKEIVVSWGAITGAEQYDLEWTFTDNYDSAGGSLAATRVPVDFEENATRVTLGERTYRISNVFENGYVVFRVRGAGYTGATFTHRVQGKWSNHGYTPQASSYGSTEKLLVASLEPTLNWQYVNTFAEDGKKKEVISFMDGSFRNRQSVTRSSSDSTIIVGETIYDHQGRPALQVLPVPVNDSRIKYYENFNLDSATAEPYSREHFDLGNCLVIAPPLGDDAGAGKYYSANNDFLAMSAHDLASHMPYVPHANGYAFVRTLYTPDNSGRVSMQSGVGRDHALNAGHATRYFYSTPFQEELDLLFGNNVGFSRHYEKEMVIDPNGQVSVSYKNLSGQVMATGLAGATPGNVTGLTSNTGSRELQVEVLSETVTRPGEYSLGIAKKINVGVSAQYRLSYLLSLDDFEDSCLATCPECVYDLELSLKDECGTELLDGDASQGGIQPFVRELKRSSGAGYSSSCSTAVNYKVTDDVLAGSDTLRITLPVGSYTLSKQLHVSSKAAAYFAEEFLAANTCTKSEADFIEYHKALIDEFGCQVTCESCQEVLADSADYVAGRYAAYVALGFNADSVLLAQCAAEYHTKKGICATICDGAISPCESMRLILEVDVSEAGQYPEMAGDITLHPEYCRYLFCTQNTGAFAFERYVQDRENGNAAILEGLMDPLKNQTAFPEGVYDTFFVSNNAYKTLLNGKLANVATVEMGGSHPLNLWEFVTYVTYCNNEPNWAAVSSCISGFDYTTGNCAPRSALAWELFRALYLKARTEALEEIRDASCTVTIPSGKEARFVPIGDIADAFPANETDMGTNFATSCSQGCDSMSASWIQLLGPCVMDHPQRENIRLALVNVCQRGCDGNNPMGASSVAPGNTSGVLPNSFREVLEDFGIYNAGTCDPNLLSMPAPYVPEPADPAEQLDSWDCLCKEYFADCTLQEPDATVKAVLKQLSYLESDTVCSNCITCDELYPHYRSFYNEYGAVPFETDSSGVQWRLIFTNLMNRSLGYELYFEDYLSFIRQCSGQDSGEASAEVVLARFREVYDIDVITGSVDPAVQELQPQSPAELRWQPIAPGRLLAENTRAAWDPESPNPIIGSYFKDLEALTLPSGYTLINHCFCQNLFLAQPTLTDTTSLALWDNAFGGCGFESIQDIEKAKYYCRQTFYQLGIDREPGSAIQVDVFWSLQARQLLHELAYKNDVGIPLACKLPCPDAGEPSPFPADSLPNPSTGVPQTGSRLTCLHIIDGVDSTMAQNSWTQLTPTNATYWKIAQFVDNKYAAVPYYRLGSWQDSAYRLERIKSEVSRCIVESTCLKNDYFPQCSTWCQAPAPAARLLRNFYKELTQPRQTGYTNHLWQHDWNMAAADIGSFAGTPLYSGSFGSNLVYKFAPPTQQNNYGKPAGFVISDASGFTVNILLRFPNYSAQNIYADIVNVLKVVPIYENPCDTASYKFNVQAVMKIAGGYDTLWLFGATDRYPLVTACGREPLLCNTPRSYPARSCILDLEAMATARGREAFLVYSDSIRKDYIHRYSSACLAKAVSTEAMKIRYREQQYHYTLYYYDLAGNLSQTVPPKGVVLLTALQQTAVANFRKGTGAAVYNAHTLVTRYSYNTMNQLKRQTTPDAGASDFWYDALGRLIVSQNAKQRPLSKFSYTRFDALGRIYQVGEIYQAVGMSFNRAFSAGAMITWLNGGQKEQVTQTYYDNAAFSITYNGFAQQYLRSRVASMTYRAVDSSTTYEQAVHYSYDVHGNVHSLVRENTSLHGAGQGFKKTDYRYELVSGNVNQVLYQSDSIDRFFHRYDYDADNRITGVQTSRDRQHWDRDARYQYYLHGPLARTTLGQLDVQGMDYAYTIHGWLKGVNSERLRPGHDIGKDGNTSGSNQWVCKDVFGFGLGYYAGDYQSVGSISTTTSFIIGKGSSDLGTRGVSLYNGNIAHLVTAISKFMGTGDAPMGQAFTYDQLNRLLSSRAYTAIDTTANTWRSGVGALSAYATDYTYDANGNILTLNRAGTAATPSMDQLTYNYISGRNQLAYVADAISATNYGIDNQSAGNYTYDSIGNLLSDAAEQIAAIEWTVYGKIRKITRTVGSSKPDLEFEYTPDGHRAAKHVTDKATGQVSSTWYSRDAQGNVLAVYRKEWFSELDTSGLPLSVIDSIILAEKGALTLGRFLSEEVLLQDKLPVGSTDLTSYKIHLSGLGLLDDALKACSPVPILAGSTLLLDDVVAAYTAGDFAAAMSAHYAGSSGGDLGTRLMQYCLSSFGTHILNSASTPMNFLEFLFNQNMASAMGVWSQFNASPYPGASAAAAILYATVPSASLYTQVVNFYGTSLHGHYASFYGAVQADVVIVSFGSLKSCTRSFTSNTTLAEALYMYNATLLWSHLYSVRTEGTLADLMIDHAPADFLREAIIQSPGYADNLLTSAGMGVTPYLTYIRNYSLLGDHFYHNLVNKLMDLGYKNDGWNIDIDEHHIYGNSRVGIHQTKKTLRRRVESYPIEVTLEAVNDIQFIRGKRNYELSNHLGNVQVVISDKRIAKCDTELEIERFEADVLSAVDYYPFGMVMPGRQYYVESDSSMYRFGFNGKESDNEAKGIGNQYDYGFRIYDPRLGKFLSIDPLTNNFPFYSPYQFAGNKPIACIDLDGLEETGYTMRGNAAYSTVEGASKANKEAIENAPIMVAAVGLGVTSFLAPQILPAASAFAAQIVATSSIRFIAFGTSSFSLLFRNPQLTQEAASFAAELLNPDPIPIAPQMTGVEIATALKGAGKLFNQKLAGILADAVETKMSKTIVSKLKGTFSDASKKFEELTVGATVVKGTTKDGKIYTTATLKDGTTVTLRDFGSDKTKTVNATIDVSPKNIGNKSPDQIEIKFTD